MVGHIKKRKVQSWFGPGTGTAEFAGTGINVNTV